MMLGAVLALSLAASPTVSCDACVLTVTPPPIVEAAAPSVTAPRLVGALSFSTIALVFGRIPLVLAEIAITFIVYSPWTIADSLDDQLGISRETGDRVITSAVTGLEFVNIFLLAAASAVLIQTVATGNLKRKALIVLQMVVGVAMLAASAVMRYGALPRHSHPYFQEFVGQAMFNRDTDGFFNVPTLLVALVPVAQTTMLAAAVVAEGPSVSAPSMPPVFTVPLIRTQF